MSYKENILIISIVMVMRISVCIFIIQKDYYLFLFGPFFYISVTKLLLIFTFGIHTIDLLLFLFGFMMKMCFIQWNSSVYSLTQSIFLHFYKKEIVV